jgi:hypothetical protein
VKPVGSTAQFTGCLGSAQQQHANQGRLSAAEIEGLAQPVLVFHNPSVAGSNATGKLLALKAVERLPQVIFVEIHHRLAVRALVAGVPQRIQRKGIVVGSCDFFFNQRAQHAGFSSGEDDRLMNSYIGGHKPIVTLIAGRGNPCLNSEAREFINNQSNLTSHNTGRTMSQFWDMG